MAERFPPIEQTDTAWDRDARAFALALVEKQPPYGALADRMSEEGIARRAVEMADEVETARRERAPQTTGRVGRCTESTKRDYGRGKHSVRCSLMHGHDGPHSFEDE
jgi:hypothetical protein